MAVPLIQNAVDSGTSASFTGSVSINLGTNANRALWAQLMCVTVAANTLTALTLGGVNVLGDVVGPTALGTMNVYNLHHVATQTGTQTLTATWASDGFKSVVAVALYGADQTAPFSGRQTQNGPSGTGLTMVVSSAVDSLVLAGAQESTGTTLTPGSGSTVIAGIAVSFRHGLQETATGASVDIGGTWGASAEWRASAVSVLGVAGGGGGTGLEVPRNLFVSPAVGRASNF